MSSAAETGGGELLASPCVGLLLDGGGARAAYQAGVLRGLARGIPGLKFPILTGVSAGAINTAHLACAVDPLESAVERLVGLWSAVRVENVFRVDTLRLLRLVASWSLRLGTGGRLGTSGARALTDTSPLVEFLRSQIPNDRDRLLAIDDNLRSGRLRAVGVMTTNYSTAQSNTWIQALDAPAWTRPNRIASPCFLTIQHILASAALPLFFPSVSLGDEWHGDGGIRLIAPLAPALHLGADRVLAISTRYRFKSDRPEKLIPGYPPPAHVAGFLLNAVFLDALDYDLATLERINGLLLAARDRERVRTDLRVVKALILRPSVDLGRLAGEFEVRLPRFFRFLTRGWGTRDTSSPDVLSMLMFQEDYLSRLIEIGEADAAARLDEVREFVEAPIHE
jgi:NTE family protein